MNIRIGNDRVSIDGYVNAVERKSIRMRDRVGEFVERICKGAFRRALARTDDVRLLLNHNKARDLGGTAEGNLELREDNIGLHASAVVTDPEVVKKARGGELVGWSFGFRDKDVDRHDENGTDTRDVKDLELLEVSLLDRSFTPAYEGNSVNVRSDDDGVNFGEGMQGDVNVEKEPVDYSEFERAIREVKYKNARAYAAYLARHDG